MNPFISDLFFNLDFSMSSVEENAEWFSFVIKNLGYEYTPKEIIDDYYSRL